MPQMTEKDRETLRIEVDDILRGKISKKII